MLFRSGTTILKIRRDYEAEALLPWRDLCPRAEPLAVNFSIIKGNHTWKFGGEWIHSRNMQVFRGLFQGRGGRHLARAFSRFRIEDSNEGMLLTAPGFCGVASHPSLMNFLPGRGRLPESIRKTSRDGLAL
jgi:hypothetical protein